MTDERLNPSIERIAEHPGIAKSTLCDHLRKWGIDRKSMTLGVNGRATSPSFPHRLTTRRTAAVLELS